MVDIYYVRSSDDTEIVPFEYFFLKISVIYLQWTKRTGKQKPEPPSPFSFAKEYRQRLASDHDFERGYEPGAFLMPFTRAEDDDPKPTSK